ncbi:Protein of unknown function [Gryllus bimaculatus]|nr:Protein of unknown function [Gryllus bimaculatus]
MLMHYSIAWLFLLLSCCYSQDPLVEQCRNAFPGMKVSEVTFNGTEVSASRETKCYVHCLFENEGTMHGNIINTTAVDEAFKKDAHNSALINAVNECKQVGGTF